MAISEEIWAYFKEQVFLRSQSSESSEFTKSSVFRDILTDCLHLAHELNINIDERLEDAKEVFCEEQELDQDCEG